MKTQKNLIANLSRIAIFAMLILAFQATTAFGQFGIPDLNSQQQISSEVEKAKSNWLNEQIKKEKAKHEQAMKIMSAATAEIFGKPSAEEKESTLIGWSESPAYSEEMQKYFLYSLAKDETPKYKGKYDAGLTQDVAAAWIKDYVTTPIVNVKWRKYIVEDAFMEVHGRKPGAAELSKYDQLIIVQKAWFKTIISKENAELKNNLFLKKELTNRAYERSMGRAATPTEIEYWKMKDGNYATIIYASRDWLYSPDGAQDLRETVTRAAAKTEKDRVSVNRINQLVAHYKKMKWIFFQMIAAR